MSELNPTSVPVEVCANGINGGTPVREEMTSTPARPTASRGRVYRATPAARPASDYTIRATPQPSGVAAPLKCAQISWQR